MTVRRSTRRVARFSIGFYRFQRIEFQRTEFRGQKIEKTEDRETDLSVFRPPPGAERRKPIYPLSSEPERPVFPSPRRDSAANLPVLCPLKSLSSGTVL
ncbi:MAG: hypothetical protein LBD06_02360 [Candidatus Accumulibacter sp.]|nr:hypothetical protein [Accumulibacter sp.]